MIADAERSVALAGIMGGEETEISDGTTEVLLEAANFEPTGIFRTSERLRLRTEGSNRWEKGVDPYLAEPAADLATRLLAETAGRDLGGRRRRARGPARAAGDPLPARARGRADRARDAAAGPAALARAARLREPRRRGGRPDLAGARRHARGRRGRGGRARRGSTTCRSRSRSAARCSARSRAEQRLRRRIEDLLAGLGLTETYTPSLRPDDANPQALRLPEPISVEFAVLRTSLLPSLVEAAGRNVELGADARRAVRGRARLPPGRRAAGRGDARRRDRGRRLGAREGDRRHALRRAQGGAELRARRARAAASRQVGGDRGRRRRRAAPGRARRRLGRVRARPGEAARGRARGGALHRRRLVPARAPGPRLRRARGR